MSIDSSPTTEARPQRADARRNRERIVEAARAAFAEAGLETQMDDVARRAGVGVGTLYRHFPTKDALVQAIVHAHMERMALLGREVLERGGDPWDSFAGFLRSCSENNLSDRALAQVMTTQPATTFRDAAEATGLVAVGDEMLRRAQAQGTARPDARVDDIPVVMCGLAAVLESWGEDAGRRYMQLVLDGLRSTAQSTLPG
jgi:AcrR family transcriptional regulator